MNILILNWRDIKNPNSGGAEVLTHEISKRWVSWGNEVTQLSSKFKGCVGEETVDGVKIVRRGNPDIRQLFQSVHFQAFLFYINNSEKRFDVIIDEVHGIPFFIPWYVKEKKVVLICEVAGDLWRKVFGPIFGMIGRLTEKFYLKFLYRNVPYLTISKSTKEDLIKNGVSSKNITILPMGINVPKKNKIFKREEDLTLTFVGRLTVPKGIEEAIYAFAKIGKSYPKAKLWVIGRGDEKYLKHLKDLSKRLNVEGKIIFFGFVPEERKFELLGRAHILIHPSLREGFGLTIPEAGFVGTPVIAYNSPGIRDIVDANNGILLKENNVEHIANAVLDLFGDKRRYKVLCSRAKRQSLSYNWDKTAKSALEILQKV